VGAKHVIASALVPRVTTILLLTITLGVKEAIVNAEVDGTILILLLTRIVGANPVVVSVLWDGVTIWPTTILGAKVAKDRVRGPGVTSLGSWMTGANVVTARLAEPGVTTVPELASLNVAIAHCHVREAAIVILPVWVPVVETTLLSCPTAAFAWFTVVRFVYPVPSENAAVVDPWPAPITISSLAAVVDPVVPGLAVTLEPVAVVIDWSSVGAPVNPSKYWAATVTRPVAAVLHATVIVWLAPPVVSTEYHICVVEVLAIGEPMRVYVLPLLSVTDVTAVSRAESSTIVRTINCPATVVTPKAPVTADPVLLLAVTPDENASAICYLF
jgi:hypothetical protein